jgi:hypothetical protein
MPKEGLYTPEEFSNEPGFEGLPLQEQMRILQERLSRGEEGYDENTHILHEHIGTGSEINHAVNGRDRSGESKKDRDKRNVEIDGASYFWTGEEYMSNDVHEPIPPLSPDIPNPASNHILRKRD